MLIWRGLGIEALLRAMQALAGDEGPAKPASPSQQKGPVRTGRS